MEAKIVNDIKKELECPVCFEFMLDTIRICNTGHSFCDLCAKQLRKCPLCKARISMDRRNLLLEQVAKEFFKDPTGFVRKFREGEESEELATSSKGKRCKECDKAKRCSKGRKS
jgi:hypothetical protein